MMKNYLQMNQKRRKYWIGVYAICAIGFLILHYAFDLKLFLPILRFIPFLKTLSFTLSILAVILLVRTVLEYFIDNLDQKRGNRYNLKRVTRLIANLLIIFFVLTSFFQNPYKSLAGLGLASLVLGFALQAPITSFIAWLYIVFRNPYQVGDRIQVSTHKGDVIEISYLDTIIQECSGDYLGNDRKSGRLIHFPNSKILTDRIINYSGQEKPFIWNETAVQVAYTSDLQFIENCLLKAALNDFNEKYPKRAEQGTDHWHPAVYFRNNQYAWMEAVVSYPVEPYDTTGRRNRILRAALPMLNAEPEKVQFPQGTHR